MSHQPSDGPGHRKALARNVHDAGAQDDVVTDLLEELEEWVGAGVMGAERENQKYFDQLEVKYPIGLNRIDWRGVRTYLVLDVLPAVGESITLDEHRRRLVEYREVLWSWLKSYGSTLTDRVIWIGDGCDLALHMTIGVLVECYPILFTYPQHNYVFPMSVAWCLNYSMEGQLFLGKAENAIARGPVELDRVDAADRESTGAEGESTQGTD